MMPGKKLFRFVFVAALLCSLPGVLSKTFAQPKTVPYLHVWPDPNKGKILPNDAGSSINGPTTTVDQHLIGRVSKAKYRYFIVHDNDSTKKSKGGSRVVYFNGLGNLVEQKFYDTLSTVSLYWHFIYKSDRLQNWNYIVNGARAKEESHWMSYDDNGRKTEERVYIVPVKDSFKIAFKYDERGNLKQEANYNMDPAKSKIVYYSYDVKGNQIASVATSEATPLVTTWYHMRAKYNATGSKTEWVYYEQKDSSDIEKMFMTYNEAGQCIETQDYQGGKLDMKVNYKYDSIGNTLEKLCYSPALNEELSVFYVYQYDKKGNIIRQEDYKLRDGKKELVGIADAVYEYY